MENNKATVIATDMYQRTEDFLHKLENQPFPSIYQDSDSLAFSFQVEGMDNIFQIGVQLDQVAEGSFLLSLTYTFMCHNKVSNGITILGVPLHSLYACSVSIEEIESEEMLYGKVYDAILDNLYKAIITILE